MNSEPKPKFITGPDVIFFLIVSCFTLCFLYWLRKDNVALSTLIVAAVATGLGQTLLFKWLSKGRTRRKW